MQIPFNLKNISKMVLIRSPSHRFYSPPHMQIRKLRLQEIMEPGKSPTAGA